MIKTIKNNQERGAALLLSITIILTVSVFVASGLTFSTLNSLASTQDKVKSIKSYYLSEAGIEDSLLRLKDNMQISSPNVLTVDNDSTTIEITEPIGGSRTITSQGNADDRIRKLAVTYQVTSDEVNFYYGAQAGDGGVDMDSNSEIQGNIFSNGDITGPGEITDTATVSGTGTINGPDVLGDTYTYSCNNTDTTGTLYYVSGGTVNNCTYGSIEVLANPIDAENLPIPQEQIDTWKTEAEAGGTISGNYTIYNNSSDSLGPVKITGNLTLNNNSTLTATGIIYVQGNINTYNNTTVQLDSEFGSLSGIIISDGKISTGNNVTIIGSGQEGSYLMMLSTNSSVNPSSPAIDLSNNVGGTIFYASNGAIYLHNNINIREATGYKLILDNNAVISYDVGLENVNFSSGPGGGWSVENWREIE